MNAPILVFSSHHDLDNNHMQCFSFSFVTLPMAPPPTGRCRTFIYMIARSWLIQEVWIQTPTKYGEHSFEFLCNKV